MDARKAQALRRTLLAAALALAGGGAAAQDSGLGVDLHFGNGLDPTGAGGYGCDADGATWLPGARKRTPTGFLYGCIPDRGDYQAAGDWERLAAVSFGYLHLGGDENNTQWRRFDDFDDGFAVAADFSLRRRADGRYFDFRASRINRDNQYYRAVFGRAGKYRVQAFVRSAPNVVSGNARSIWDGVGSDHLTLKPGLVPAGSTPDQVAAVSAAQPERLLQVVRDKQGIGVNYFIDRRWTAYLNASHEQRKGARPFGGPFFFNYPFPSNGGIYELPRPIDDSTVNLNGGARFVGNVWRMDFSYTGSFFRNGYRSYDYQVPYGLYPVVPGVGSPVLTTGQFAYEPDNDYHHLRTSFSRKLAWNGDFSLSAALGTMRQNDRLLAPMSCQGQFGLEMGPAFLFDCDDWNTPQALSRQRADLSIDTQRLDARLVLQPGRNVTWRGNGRYFREDYSGTYFAYNPLTSQWGYVAENGAQGSVVPGEMGVWDPLLSPSVVTRVRNLPLDKETWELVLGGDWRLDRRNTLGATYQFTRVERSHREVATTRDNSIKLTWSNRALDWLTLRANYTYLDRSGSAYYYDPYEFTFSTDLPGFVEPAGGTAAHTVSALRKYDLASRTQHKLDLMATFVLPREMTLYASLRGDRSDYDAELGRQGYDTLGASLQWEWQPGQHTVAGAWYGYDESELRFANVNDLGTLPDPTLGGGTYPDSARWWLDDRQRNHYAGATLNRRIGRATLDLAWNWTDSRGITAYRFASPDALTSPALAALASGRYPPMTYRLNTLTASLSFPLSRRVGLRIFDTYERGRLSDWHYLGFDQTLVYDHRVYTDGGPTDYSVNLVGVMLEVKL